LRVLIYTTLFPNSMLPLKGSFVLERMRHLPSSIEMKVVAPVPYFPPLKVNPNWFRLSRVPRRETYRGFEIDHPRYVVIPKVGMAAHGIAMFLGSLRRVWKNARSQRFHLIDAHYVYPDGLAAILLGRMLSTPVVISARGSDINLFPKFPTIRPLIRHVLKKADAVIAVSQSLKDAMTQLGCPEDKITVIGNGVDSEKFKPLPKATVRQQLGLPRQARIVLAVGHLVELKGFQVLIEAVSRLRARMPDILLVIVGEGVFRSSLEQQVSRLGLEHSVRLVGAVPHETLSSWYSAADMFCLASSSEGSPNVVLEALACGLPVLSTDVGSVAEILDAGNCGALVTRTPEAFERAISEAFARAWDREAIVSYAGTHGWNVVADKLVSVYRTVLESRRNQAQPDLENTL
jgi:glycosyltransferase involved in cell wall biosynthesis